MEITLALEVLVAVGLLLLLWYWIRPPGRMSEFVNKFPGPPTIPILGNAHLVGRNTTEFFASLDRLQKEYRSSPVRKWMGNMVFLLLSLPQDLEIVMGSNKLINKAHNYKLLHSWLGTGLLTSTGAKWRRSRKILTPTFHFKILEEFVDVFFANGETLIECLKAKVGGPGFDIHHYITLNALDNICETAMGLKINAQKDTESKYVQAVRDQSVVVMTRGFKVWLQNDFIYRFSSEKKTEDKALHILHSTTESVIKSRREEILKEREAGGDASVAQVSEYGTKRRLAFLDLLIQSTFEGSEMTDENIREEVDTFMFEGHDTTAAGITYTIWLLSWHPEIQEAVFQELDQVWPDRGEILTYQQIQELRLLERVIKETLRLYPSVPFFGRELSEDVVLSGGLTAPKGANVTILAFAAHKDPDFFPDPEKFDPDRFLPENVQGRHPYAYIPFSAGPRNCIGQKFALLEMKCTLAHVLSKYRFTPAAGTQELKLSSDLILTAKDGVPVYIHSRE